MEESNKSQTLTLDFNNKIMENYTVGVIGNGFVGESQAFAFSPTSEVKIYDKNPLKSTHTLEETCQSDFVFVAVPTPMKKMVPKIFHTLKMFSTQFHQDLFIL